MRRGQLIFERTQVARRASAGLDAPVRSRLVRAQAQSGEFVRQGQEVASLIDCTRLLVTAEAGDRIFRSLRLRMPGAFAPVGGEPYWGRSAHRPPCGGPLGPARRTTPCPAERAPPSPQAWRSGRKPDARIGIAGTPARHVWRGPPVAEMGWRPAWHRWHGWRGRDGLPVRRLYRTCRAGKLHLLKQAFLRWAPGCRNAGSTVQVRPPLPPSPHRTSLDSCPS